jgi:hypothetical protein
MHSGEARLDPRRSAEGLNVRRHTVHLVGTAHVFNRLLPV